MECDKEKPRAAVLQAFRNRLPEITRDSISVYLYFSPFLLCIAILKIYIAYILYRYIFTLYCARDVERLELFANCCSARAIGCLYTISIKSYKYIARAKERNCDAREEKKLRQTNKQRTDRNGTGNMAATLAIRSGERNRPND